VKSASAFPSGHLKADVVNRQSVAIQCAYVLHVAKCQDVEISMIRRVLRELLNPAPHIHSMQRGAKLFITFSYL
jgi:hypothetical protein